MKGLMSPQKNVFRAKRREGVVKPGKPLWHPHVTCVLRFEQKLEKATRGCSQNPSPISRHATVRRDSEQSAVSVGNESQGNLVAGEDRRPEDSPDKIVVEEWGPHGQLRLLQRQHPMEIPGALPEGGNGNRMPTKGFRTSLLSSVKG